MIESFNNYENLIRWVANLLNYATEDLAIEPISGDASPRRYFRIRLLFATPLLNASTAVAVFSPPSEKNMEFLRVCDLLAGEGIVVPKIFGANVEEGFFLLEDFGDDLLFNKLSTVGGDRHYKSCFQILEKMFEVDTEGKSLTGYNRLEFANELELFCQWFMNGLLEKPLRPNEQLIFSAMSNQLIIEALAQPTVLVHRDFHSRNLMCLESGELGVIDFQDAVVGPFTYDLVSLLKDCYIELPRTEQLAWLTIYLEQLHQAGYLQCLPKGTVIRWFDLMGLQRHLKVLGIFSRLYLRDDKPTYLVYLPRVILYIREVLKLYSSAEVDIKRFQVWFETRVVAELSSHSWWKP